MKWLLINMIAAAAGTALAARHAGWELSQPLVFIAVYSIFFLGIWLLTFFVHRKYFFKLTGLARFILFIVKELFTSSFRVAYDVLTPVDHLNPAIIAVPLDATTDREIAALSAFITFTPGTLALKISDDRKTLYVHEMYVAGNDVEAVRMKIKNEFEKKLLELMR